MSKVIIAIPCLLRGGTEMQTLLLSRALIEFGYAVEVCCYFESDKKVVKEFQATGVAVNLLNWPRSIGAVRLIRSLAAVFRQLSPAFVHVQYMAPGLLPVIGARLARVPAIFATVNYPGTPHGIAAHILLRFGAELTNYFICVSEAAEKSWFNDSCILDPDKRGEISARRHFTIPNAVNIEEIDKALDVKSQRCLDWESQLSGSFVVGTAARLSPEKGVDILIEAFAKLHNAVPNTCLLIVGDGNQRSALQDLAAKLSISDYIIWAGRLSWEETVCCLGFMDVVAVPSRFEGFGFTAIEAMACRKPVVASDVDGLSEIIKNGTTGILVPVEDSFRLANALTALSKDKERRQEIGAVARKHIEATYVYPIYRERIRVLYEALNP